MEVDGGKKKKEVFSPFIWMTAASMPGMLESDLENVVWNRQEIPLLQKSASNRLM